VIVIVGDKHYPGVQVEDLSLLNVMALQRELTLHNISRCKTWEDVQGLVSEMAALSTEDRKAHPEMLFMTCLLVWAARVSAGERVSLLDAVDVPVTQVRFVSEPQDRAPGKAKAPKRSPKGSARGV
jgi:hypothetical protein